MFYVLVSKKDEYRVIKMTVDDRDYGVLKLEVDMGRLKLSKTENARWKWKVDDKDDGVNNYNYTKQWVNRA